MDLLLVDSDARLTRIVLESLAYAEHAVVQVASAAGPGLWPRPLPARAILLGFDLPSPARLRALHRLWAADDLPPAYLLTAPGSVGDCMLCTLLGPRCATPEWIAGRPTPHHRSVRELSIEHLLSLERLMRGDSARSTRVTKRTAACAH